MTTDYDAYLKGSEVRLWKLIEQRCALGTDHAAQKVIDERIWDLFGEEWAVMFTDLSGFSRQVATFGIIHFLQVIFEHKRLLLPVVQEHDGILIKIEADSLMIIFKRADRALECAVAMQRACQAYSAARAAEEKVLLCVGIGHGRILRIGDSDVYGQEVNAASKLGEDTAKRDEILVTEAVKRAVGDVAGIGWEDLAEAVAGSEKNFRVRY